MILTVSTFRSKVLGGGAGELIAELVDLTGRDTVEERKAWTESFTRLAHAFDSPALSPMHLYFGNHGNLALEYRLPASSSWCDVVLLGRNERTPAAVILELKHWDTRNDNCLPNPGLIQRREGLWLHPAEQVKGYTEYCRRFHSVVQDAGARVDGCVVFTARPLNPAYCGSPNLELVQEFPCFSVAAADEAKEAMAFLNQRLVRPDADFASAFERGHYRQDRSFIRAIGATLQRSPHRRLELLDEQRTGLRIACAAVQQALAQHHQTVKKYVVIVEGPPGSGKSAVAAQLWAELAADQNLPVGDLAFVTTSQAQNHNLEHLFGAGQGAVKKASQFSPSTTHELGQLNRRFPGQFSDVAAWRKNLETLRVFKGAFDPRDDAYLVSIVDEAHALINPEHSDARGQFGFPVNFGPLGYHIIRGSVVSVFLLDEEQGFRERETTTREDLVKWAAELGAKVMPVVSLKDRQFRCGGSTEYVAWVDGLVQGIESTALNLLSDQWRMRPAAGDSLLVAETPADKIVEFPSARREFALELVDSLPELDAVLSDYHANGKTVRLVASYARKWKTENTALPPHGLPPAMQDFFFTWQRSGRTHTWSRIWNWKNAPDGYVSWVDPSPGVPMAANPLAEVGCPYTVRGFDFDYLGLLWLHDVLWRDGRWQVQPEKVFETGLNRHRQRTEQESDPNGPAHQALLKKLLQGYRILLTRAIKGVYIWCEDEETQERLRQCLGEQGGLRLKR